MCHNLEYIAAIVYDVLLTSGVASCQLVSFENEGEKDFVN